jgi:hypothetical protein
LFDNRFLFVQKNLTASEWKTFRKITRGFPELRKLREMVDLVYGLYDRRCKRSTALAKLRKLRERLKRFDGLSEVLKKIESPTVDRSLFFLDDKKLPSTSNAVERGNRRFRKMQKTVYRVRTIDRIRERIALDISESNPLSMGDLVKIVKVLVHLSVQQTVFDDRRSSSIATLKYAIRFHSRKNSFFQSRSIVRYQKLTEAALTDPIYGTIAVCAPILLFVNTARCFPRDARHIVLTLMIFTDVLKISRNQI